MSIKDQTSPRRSRISRLVSILLVAKCISAMVTSNKPASWNQYPKAYRDPAIIDHMHGKPISDPYRWLENPESGMTKEFIDAQNNLTNEYMDKVKYRSALQDKLTAMVNFERVSYPSKEGDYYYFWYNSGLMNHDVIKRQVTTDAPSEIFFDPNTLSDDGTVAVRGTAFSWNATYFAYGTSNAGSDWMTIRVKHVANQTDLPDVIEFAKFSGIDWTWDEKGFFYTRHIN